MITFSNLMEGCEVAGCVGGLLEPHEELAVTDGDVQVIEK